MQTRRKCEQCNTLNDVKQTYCVNCGKYLKGKISQKDSKLTIWGVDESKGKCHIDSVQSHRASHQAPQMVVVCPECLTKSDVNDHVLPLSCPVCGYFFQAGIDRIVSAADAATGKTVDASSTSVNRRTVITPTPAPLKTGPLQTAAHDTTSLRITSITSNTLLPEFMKEVGNILGKNGTVFRAFTSNMQISIWHTSTGWYARATIGMPLYNGVPMNQGNQVKLSAGDLLVIDREQFMIEIF